MKNVVITFCLMFAGIYCNAQNFGWAGQFSGAARQEGQAIVVDPSGNVYTAGDFAGEADFDPGPDTFLLTSAGYYDIYISKLDASGNFLWALSFGGPDQDVARDLALNDEGNISITGYFTDSIDFDPGPAVHYLNAHSSADIFILTLDPNGNFETALQMGGPDYSAAAYSIAFDLSGNILTTGAFRTAADFDPDTGSYILEGIGLADIFICKLDAAGNFLWAKEIGSTQDDAGWEVKADGDGNVVTIGGFRGTTDFDPGPDTLWLTSAGEIDTYISKLDPGGELLWAVHFGNNYSDYGYSFDIGQDNSLYLTGWFMGTVDFDPGPGTANLTSSMDYDAFVAHYDTAGNFVWVKQIGGERREFAMSLVMDNTDAIYITGMFTGTVDFDPGPGTFNLIAPDSFQDIFVMKLDNNGNFLWAKQMGAGGYDQGNAIAVDAAGNAYTTGFFMETVDFDPGNSIYNLTAAGDYDSFVLKLTPGVNNIESAGSRDELFVFPNPGNNHMMIKVPDMLSGQPFLLIDETGRVVDTGILRGSLFRLDMDGLHPGLYLLKVNGYPPLKVLTY